MPATVEQLRDKKEEVSPHFSCKQRDFGVAAGLGFEPRLTDPLESVVLPLHQPIWYEKVFQSLTNLALKLLTDRLSNEGTLKLLLALNPKQAGHFKYPEGFGRAGYRLEHLVSEPQIDL